MSRHRIDSFRPTRGRTGILFSCSRQPRPNRILFDISLTSVKLFQGENLGLVVAPFPYSELALEAERKASLDELHRLFERDIWRGRKKDVQVIRHYNKCVQRKPVLLTVALEGIEKEYCVGFHLEESAAVGCYSGDEIGAQFLWRGDHRNSIQKPGPEGPFCARPVRGAEAPRSLRDPLSYIAATPPVLTLESLPCAR